MTTIYIVAGEHPFNPGTPVSVHKSLETATARAVLLTNTILDDFWPIFQDGARGLQPVATADNWMLLSVEYGEVEDFIQDERWGCWDVWIETATLED